MKAAVIMPAGTDRYLILLPDKTVANATEPLLGDFISKFHDIDNNPLFKNGTEGNWTDDDHVIRKSKLFAYITDDGTFIMYDFTPFEKSFSYTKSQTKYLSVAEYAEKYGKSVELIKMYCQKGRLPGAVKIGKRWGIPDDAPYPADTRVTSGGIYRGVHAQADARARAKKELEQIISMQDLSDKN